jgi:hypothetical protein
VRDSNTDENEERLEVSVEETSSLEMRTFLGGAPSIYGEFIVHSMRFRGSLETDLPHDQNLDQGLAFSACCIDGQVNFLLECFISQQATSC